MDPIRGTPKPGNQRRRNLPQRKNFISRAACDRLRQIMVQERREVPDAVQAELKTAAQGKTALVIAHRLSTVVDAHEIVVLEAGRVVERGPHADLLALDGRYARMWRLQQSGGDEAHGNTMA